MTIDLIIEDPRWNTLALDRLAGDAVRATLAHLQLRAADCEVSLLACDDGRIAVLNAGFRDQNSATNVLSWPLHDLAATTPGAEPAAPQPDFTGGFPLGDIAISWDTCTREAQAAGIEMADHVSHLLVHGVLHLLGYDHIRDADATLMMKKEVEILGKLGIADPY